MKLDEQVLVVLDVRQLRDVQFELGLVQGLVLVHDKFVDELLQFVLELGRFDVELEFEFGLGMFVEVFVHILELVLGKFVVELERGMFVAERELGRFVVVLGLGKFVVGQELDMFVELVLGMFVELQLDMIVELELDKFVVGRFVEELDMFVVV